MLGQISFCLKANSSSELAVFIVCCTKTFRQATHLCVDVDNVSQPPSELHTEAGQPKPTHPPKQGHSSHKQDSEIAHQPPTKGGEETGPTLQAETPLARLRPCSDGLTGHQKHARFRLGLCVSKRRIHHVEQRKTHHAAVQQEEHGEPFADVLHNHAARRTPVSKKYLKPKFARSKPGQVDPSWRQEDFKPQWLVDPSLKLTVWDTSLIPRSLKGVAGSQETS